MAERTKATVLKTVDGVTHPWVRIPLLPLDVQLRGEALKRASVQDAARGVPCPKPGLTG
jgi:hypothetical protein